MQFLLLILSWFVLAILSTMRFTVQPQFSDSERTRLADLGDRAALGEELMLEQLPLFRSLQTILVTLSTAAFVAVAIQQNSVTSGIVIATLGLLLVPTVYRIKTMRSLADWSAQKIRPLFERAIGYIRPVLVWLRDRDTTIEQARLHSQTELLELVRSSPGVLNKTELERLEANLRFDTTKVADIMTPRSMISAVEAHEALGPLVLDELYKTGFSRFPVYKKDLDHMVGMLYLHDLVDLKQGERAVEQAMHKKVYYVNAEQTLAHALAAFLKTHHHLFVVVNEYRETVGLLSLEDTIEKLIGSTIVDEFDAHDDLRAVAAQNPRKNNLPINRQDI